MKLSILTRVLQRQLKLEEDTGDIDPYTQHWTLECITLWVPMSQLTQSHTLESLLRVIQQAPEDSLAGTYMCSVCLRPQHYQWGLWWNYCNVY